MTFEIDKPDTKVKISSKIVQKAGTGIFVNQQDSGGGDLEMYLEIGKHFKDALSTGILQGGELEVGSVGVDTFTIRAGDGLIVDNYTPVYPAPPNITAVNWTDKENIVVTNIATQIITFVSIDSGGNVIQRSNHPTNEQRRDEIFLGVIVHVDKVNVNTVNQETITTSQPVQQLRDLAFAIGFFNVSGNVFVASLVETPAASGNFLGFYRTTGKLYYSGANYDISRKNPDVKTFSPDYFINADNAGNGFQYRLQEGTNRIGSPYGEKAIDPDIWDDGTPATFATVSPNKWTIQTIYMFISGDIKLQPGQKEYNSLALAKTGLKEDQGTFVKEPSMEANGLIRGWIIVKQGASDLNDPSEALFVEAERFGSSAGAGGTSVSNLQNAYDNSNNPEITTDSTRGAVSIKRGSAADTDDVVEVLNGAGTKNFAVDGNGDVFTNGLVDGVDIANHVLNQDYSHDTIDQHIDGLGNPHQTSLSNLTDTTIGLLSKGQLLIWNGSTWVENPSYALEGRFLKTDPATSTGVAWVDVSIKDLIDVYDSMAPTDGQVLTWDNANSRWDAADAAGGVTGPVSSTDNALVRWDGAGGGTVQNSGWTLGDTNIMSAGGVLNMGANDIEFNSGTQITLNADGTSDKYILANGNNIEHYTNGVHLFDMSAAISVFRIKHSGTNTAFGYTEILNSDNDKIVRFYADNKVELSNKTFTFRENGTTIGLPMVFNGSGANLAATGATKPIAFGDSNGTGGLVMPVKVTFAKIGAGA
jgi:hypothetical protein